jgi:hypothetical protein
MLSTAVTAHIYPHDQLMLSTAVTAHIYLHDQLMLSTAVTAHIYPHVFNLSEVNKCFSINCIGRTASSYELLPDIVMRSSAISFSHSHYPT